MRRHSIAVRNRTSTGIHIQMLAAASCCLSALVVSTLMSLVHAQCRLQDVVIQFPNQSQYPTGDAQFGPQCVEDLVQNLTQLDFYPLPNGGTGCSPLSDNVAESASGKAVLVQRGDCSFTTKAEMIQRVNGTLMIVYQYDISIPGNDKAWSPAFRMLRPSTAHVEITIPCVSVDHSVGLAMINMINDGTFSLHCNDTSLPFGCSTFSPVSPSASPTFTRAPTAAPVPCIARSQFDGGPHYQCTSQGLYDIPIALSPASTIVDLQENWISVVEPARLQELTALRRLYLANNRITEVAGDAFAALTNLRILLLHQNRIRFIEAGALQNLTLLSQLTLDNPAGILPPNPPNPVICNATGLIGWQQPLLCTGCRQGLQFDDSSGFRCIDPPTTSPTSIPTLSPTTLFPTIIPTTSIPTLFPTTLFPTVLPTTIPPTAVTVEPTPYPSTLQPTSQPVTTAPPSIHPARSLSPTVSTISPSASGLSVLISSTLAPTSLSGRPSMQSTLSRSTSTPMNTPTTSSLVSITASTTHEGMNPTSHSLTLGQPTFSTSGFETSVPLSSTNSISHVSSGTMSTSQSNSFAPFGPVTHFPTSTTILPLVPADSSVNSDNTMSIEYILVGASVVLVIILVAIVIVYKKRNAKKPRESDEIHMSHSLGRLDTFEVANPTYRRQSKNQHTVPVSGVSCIGSESDTDQHSVSNGYSLFGSTSSQVEYSTAILKSDTNKLLSDNQLQQIEPRYAECTDAESETGQVPTYLEPVDVNLTYANAAPVVNGYAVFNSPITSADYAKATDVVNSPTAHVTSPSENAYATAVVSEPATYATLNPDHRLYESSIASSASTSQSTSRRNSADNYLSVAPAGSTIEAASISRKILYDRASSAEVASTERRQSQVVLQRVLGKIDVYEIDRNSVNAVLAASPGIGPGSHLFIRGAGDSYITLVLVTGTKSSDNATLHEIPVHFYRIFTKSQNGSSEMYLEQSPGKLFPSLEDLRSYYKRRPDQLAHRLTSTITPTVDLKPTAKKTLLSRRGSDNLPALDTTASSMPGQILSPKSGSPRQETVIHSSTAFMPAYSRIHLEVPVSKTVISNMNPVETQNALPSID